MHMLFIWMLNCSKEKGIILDFKWNYTVYLEWEPVMLIYAEANIVLGLIPVVSSVCVFIETKKKKKKRTWNILASGKFITICCKLFKKINIQPGKFH